MITGAFDSSASVFLCYRLVYMGMNGTFKPEYFFFGFGVVILFMILGAEYTLMLPRHYNPREELDQRIGFAQDAGRDEYDSDCQIASPTELQRVRSRRAQDRKKQLSMIETVAGDAGKRRQRRERESERQDISGVWGVLHSEPVSMRIATPWFLVILALTVLQMQRMNYFIVTIRAQYRYMLDSEVLAERINDLFDVALPAAGVLSTPFIGILLNNVSAVNILGVLTAFIVSLGMLNCLANFCAGYATVIVFVFFKPLYYSAVSDYITKVFGFANFGRIYGAIICVSGFANLAQPLLDFLTHTVL